jgi:hypothetical protein
MSISTGRAKMKTHDAATSAPSQTEAERNAIDQVRELLFGETRRTTDHRLEDLSGKVDALAADLGARFDKLESTVAALTRDTETRRLQGIESIGGAIAELGAHIKKLGSHRAGG